MLHQHAKAVAAVVFAASLSSTAAADAQQPRAPARNAVYFEFGGNALYYSLNYDRRLQDNLTARIGVMYASAEGQDISGNRVDVGVALIPLMMNLLVGGGSSRLELGAGPVFGLASGEAETLDEGNVSLSAFGLGAFTATVGYRYQPVRGGFVFRAALVPFLSDGANLWGGISLGYAF
jgi:hypothetical protein